METVLDKVVSWLVDEEGYRQFPYKDSVNVLTVGIGRNLEAVGIRPNEAMMLARNDAGIVLEQLARQLDFWAELSDLRKAVLVDMGFNLGVPGLLKFVNTLDLIRQKNYRGAAQAMLKSKWAKQVGKRADRLAFIMQNDSEPLRGNH